MTYNSRNTAEYYRYKLRNLKVVTPENLILVAIAFLNVISYMNALKGATSFSSTYFPTLPAQLVGFTLSGFLILFHFVTTKSIVADLEEYGIFALFSEKKIMIKVGMTLGVFFWLWDLEKQGGGLQRVETAQRTVTKLSKIEKIKIQSFNQKLASLQKDSLRVANKLNKINNLVSALEDALKLNTASRRNILTSQRYTDKPWLFKSRVNNLTQQIKYDSLKLSTATMEESKLEDKYDKSQKLLNSYKDSVTSLTLKKQTNTNNFIENAERDGRNKAGWMLFFSGLLTIILSILKFDKTNETNKKSRSYTPSPTEDKVSKSSDTPQILYNRNLKRNVSKNFKSKNGGSKKRHKPTDNQTAHFGAESDTFGAEKNSNYLRKEKSNNLKEKHNINTTNSREGQPIEEGQTPDNQTAHSDTGKNFMYPFKIFVEKSNETTKNTEIMTNFDFTELFSIDSRLGSLMYLFFKDSEYYDCFLKVTVGDRTLTNERMDEEFNLDKNTTKNALRSYSILLKRYIAFNEKTGYDLLNPATYEGSVSMTLSEKDEILKYIKALNSRNKNTTK